MSARRIAYSSVPAPVVATSDEFKLYFERIENEKLVKEKERVNKKKERLEIKRQREKKRKEAAAAKLLKKMKK